MQRTRLVVGLVAAVLLVLGGIGIYRYQALSATAQKERDQAAGEIASRDTTIATLQGELAVLREENADLSESLRTAEKKNDSFDDQIRKLSRTVGDLDKLAKTDPELLMKYSKVFFLSENYVPSRITDIPAEYVSPAAVRTPLSFHAEALPYLESMLDAAREDDVMLQVLSAYRSFGTQSDLKTSYRQTYGSGANAFSADQGYSEHQLGTTADFTDPNVGGTFAGFDKTEAFAWMHDNAYRYGFILSYPAGNAYYQYEPWHWRFVGTDLARQLRRDGKAFYELDQRTLDTYLGDLFD